MIRDPKWRTLISENNELMHERQIEWNEWWIGCKNDAKILRIVSRWRCDEGLTPTKDGGKCLRRLSMFRKEVH